MSLTSDDILRMFMQERLDKQATPERPSLPITRVELEEEFDYGWSESTPGSGWQLQVKCFIDNGRRPFINELCQYGAELAAVALAA